MIDKFNKQKIIQELLPELEKLVENLPQFGEISLRAKICDYKVGTISTAKEISKRIQKSNKGE